MAIQYSTINEPLNGEEIASFAELLFRLVRSSGGGLTGTAR